MPCNSPSIVPSGWMLLNLTSLLALPSGLGRKHHHPARLTEQHSLHNACVPGDMCTLHHWHLSLSIKMWNLTTSCTTMAIPIIMGEVKADSQQQPCKSEGCLAGNQRGKGAAVEHTASLTDKHRAPDSQPAMA